MSCCVFFRRCSLCRGLANTAMHLTRPLQFRAAQQDPEPAAFCVQVMASVIRTTKPDVRRVSLSLILVRIPNRPPPSRLCYSLIANMHLICYQWNISKQ